jgi:hypothetical protein
MGIFYGVQRFPDGPLGPLMRDVSLTPAQGAALRVMVRELKPALKRELLAELKPDWRRRLALREEEPAESADEVSPAPSRLEYPLGDKRISRGEPGEVTKPAADRRRNSHGEGRPRLEEREKIARKQIYRNLGLSDDDENEFGGAVARRKAGKTARMSMRMLASAAIRNPGGGVEDQVLTSLALGSPRRGPCPH